MLEVKKKEKNLFEKAFFLLFFGQAKQSLNQSFKKATEKTGIDHF